MDDFAFQKQETQFSIRDFIFKYIKYIPLYILCIALGMLASWLYLRYTHELYSSSGSMIIKTGESGSTSDKVEELITKKTGDRKLQNEIEVLRSKPLMKRVIEDLNLQYTYFAKGKVKEANAYTLVPFELETIALNDSAVAFSIPVEFVNASQFKIGNQATPYNLGQSFKNSYGIFKLNKKGNGQANGKYRIDYTPSDALAASYINNINIYPKVQGSDILVVENKMENPYLAADIVNGLMNEYNFLTVEQGNEAMKNTIGFVDKRLSVLERDIDSLNNKLIAYNKSNQIVDAQTQMSGYLEQALSQERVLQEGQQKLGNLSQLEGSIRGSSDNSLIPSTAGVEDPALMSIVEKYNQAVMEKKAMLEANTPADNPQIKALDAQISNLRRTSLENVNMLRRSYGRAYGAANSLRSANQSKAINMPEKVQEQVAVERELASKLSLYKILDTKREEAAISSASTVAGSTIVEKANPNTTPVYPNHNTVKLMGLLFGFLLPTAFIFLKEVTNDKITTRSDISKATDAPILGEVGHSSNLKTLVIDATNRTVVAEQFRIIRANLQYIIGKRDQATILVTSSFSGDGKSFISTNVGAVLALTGKKVIILEFDLRKPRILAGLDMTKGKGISNYLISDEKLDNLIKPVPEHQNLFVLPCGPIPPNPAELLLTDKITTLFDELKSKFDFVVIDTAPVGMVSDAMALGKFADCTLYVTRQSHTYKRQAELIQELYKSEKLPHISIILNDVKIPTGGSGYYGNYGYGYYGYGQKHSNKYYVDEDPRHLTLIDKLNPVNWFK